MESITLKAIYRENRKVNYDFYHSHGLDCYFSGKAFWIEYPESIEFIPDSVLAVPFVCCVLPIIWLTDAELIIPELDAKFYSCIKEVKKGYETMYPETEWKGSIVVRKVVPCERLAASGKCAMFYSGGVDSMQTLISHLQEKPTLISVWGSDVWVDNVDGWKKVFSAIDDAANYFDLPVFVIRSTFREFDNEGALDRDFHGQLQDGWWHGVKHGIALLGHVAPLAYLYCIERMYIASSHCPEDGQVRCASNPIIDNYMRYANCVVVHDGFEYSRQKKIQNIVKYSENHKMVPVHVCWESQTGSNCCHCEKCFRTIIGIMSEGGNPEKSGFNNYKAYLHQSRKVVCQQHLFKVQKSHWTKIKKAVEENRAYLQRLSEWKDIKWILKTDFDHPEKIKLPLLYRIKSAKGIRGKLSQFMFYQYLKRMKEQIFGGNDV